MTGTVNNLIVGIVATEAIKQSYKYPLFARPLGLL